MVCATGAKKESPINPAANMAEYSIPISGLKEEVLLAEVEGLHHVAEEPDFLGDVVRGTSIHQIVLRSK